MAKFNLTVLVKLKNIISISITESISTLNLLINSQSGSCDSDLSRVGNMPP